MRLGFLATLARVRGSDRSHGTDGQRAFAMSLSAGRIAPLLLGVVPTWRIDMAARHSPQTHLKRQRERAKQEKRLEKLARRQQRSELKRAAKQEGTTPNLPPPQPPAPIPIDKHD